MLLRSFTVIFFTSCVFIVSGEYESKNSLAGNFIANFEEDYRQIEQFSEYDDADAAITFARNHGQQIYDRFDGFVNEMERSPRVKRRATAKQDSSSYILTGFIANGTIPVNFPRDICLIEIQGVTYAAALHLVTEANENKTLFTIFQKQKIDGEYKTIYTTETRSATCMDCIAMGAYGYIAVVYTIKNSTTNVAGDGSPIFQIQQRTKNDVVEAVVQIVQYFTEPHQNRVYLRDYGNNIYLLQSFMNPMHYGLGKNANCQIYKWSGYNFDVIDELPCSNAMRIEPFLIGSDIYIVIANYMDVYDDIETFSFVYKFSPEHMAYKLTQKLRTYAAVDAKYFYLEENGEIEHFLVVANSHERRTENGTSTENFEMNSIIYKFVNGYFTPFQTILLYDIKQFLPVLTAKKEFILLISCNDQDTKAWQYNGWTFFESEVQFTGGALGKGVSNMRPYPWVGSNVLVVANSNMLSDDTNLYMPVFKQQHDSKYLRAGTDGRSWCTVTMEHLQSQNLDSLSNELGTAPKNTDSTVSLEHSITFEQLTAKTVTTKSLKTISMELNQMLADQLNAGQKMIEKLDKQLNRLDTQLKQSNLPPQEAITSETQSPDDVTIVPPPLEIAAQISLNVPIHYESHQDLDYLNVNELTVDFINGNPISQLLYADRDLNIRSLLADTIYVNSSQTYQQLFQGQVPDLQVTASAPTEHIEYSDVTDTISVDSLIVDGTINEMDLDTIKQFALKAKATEQNIRGSFDFVKLRAYGVSVQTKLVSGRNLSDLIRTEGGSYYVSQDVRFDEPLHVDRLYVNERINNLRVQNGRFDVLLKNSNETQTITGHKSFNSVRLLNPIVLHGKINSSNLNSMNPIVSVTNDIVLEGDYEITGTVTIRGQLHGQNLYGSSGMFNVKQLHEEGLQKNASVINAYIEFAQPIKTDSLIIKGTVNSVNVSSFVCDADVHSLSGVKTFAGDLHVKDGFCDAFNINGIEMEMLNKTVLKRSGDQEVHGKIHFKQIIVNKSSSRSTMFMGKEYSNYLTHTDQSIPGEVHVKGDLTIRNAVKIKNLRTMGSLCGHDLNLIMEDTVLQNVPSRPIRGNIAFVGDVSIDEIDVHGKLFQIGTWPEILNNLQRVQDDIELQGPIKFQNRFRMKELMVDGELNGIPGDRFGRLWLLKDSDQDFTEPQEVVSLIANEILLNGNINDLRLNGIFENTVWLNESLTLKQARFNQLISDQPLTVPGAIGGIKFPEEVVLSTAESQEIIGPIIFDQDVIITGNLVISGSVNGINFNKLCDLIAAESAFGMQILGEAIFASEPRVDVLNGVNIQSISDATWFLNENTHISGNLTFEQVDFSSNVDLKGLLNSKDLSYISQNYFSLSKPQDVHVNIDFGNNVMFEDILEANEIQLLGVIQDSYSERSFRVDDFEKHALTKDTNQLVTGRWEFYEATILGNMASMVNELDLSIDVIRYSVPTNNVTAPKYFKNVIMKDLSTTATVQEVNIVEWFTKAAFIEGNYTIQGTTVIENPIFYNNVKVFGLVNNLPFNADTILLKSINQNIRGNLYVFTKYLADQKILPLSFENAKLTSINGLQMTEFFAIIARLDETSLKIHSNLTFVEPLTVGSLSTTGKWNGISLVGAIAQLQSNQYASNYTSHLDRLQSVGRSIITNLQNRKSQLVSYQLRQSLPGDVQRIVVLQYVVNDKSRVVYAIFSRPNPLGVVNFYKWDLKTSTMIIDNDHFALQPKDMYIVDIMSLRLYGHDYLIIETADPHAFGLSKWTFFAFFNNKFRNVYERYNNGTHKNMVSVTLSPGRSCYATYSLFDSHVLLSCAHRGDLSVLLFEEFDEFVTMSPIQQVAVATEVECSELIILDALGTVYVWQLSVNETINRFEVHQTIRAIHDARHIATIRHAGTMYLVATSEHVLNSTHFGSVEVYKSINGQYEHMQSIPADLAVQSELTTDVATQELVLYILTENSVRPLVVYKFAGVDGFQQFFVATTLPPSRSFSLLYFNNPMINEVERRKTLVTLLTKETRGAYIIEPIVN